MSGKVQHSGFESRAYGRERRKYTARYFSHPYSSRYSRSKDSGGSMLTKMGICALLAGLVLMSEFPGVKNNIMEVSSGENTAIEDIGGDYLGKLRFVELPGIMQVFSSDSRLHIGVDYTDFKLNDDKTIMTLTGITSNSIPAPADGTIKSLSREDTKTRIELSIDGDMVLSYTAAGNAAVEEGQPIRSGDTLFKSAEYVEIGIVKGGRPLDPTEFYDMGNRFLS